MMEGMGKAISLLFFILSVITIITNAQVICVFIVNNVKLGVNN